MWWTMRPKSSLGAACADKAQHKTAATTANRCLLLFIAALLLFLGLVMIAVAVHKVVLKPGDLVHWDCAHNVDDGQLPGLGHQNGDPRNLLALFEKIDLILFTSTLVNFGDDARPARRGELLADGLNVSLAVLVGRIKFKALYVNSLEALHDRNQVGIFLVIVQSDELGCHLKQRSIERHVGKVRGFVAQLVQIGKLQPGALRLSLKGSTAQHHSHKNS